MSLRSTDRRLYDQIHGWLRWNFEKPESCENCGSTDRRLEWANISGEYRKDRSDYKALCAPCHRVMDKGDYCINGHLFDEENTYYLTGHAERRCRRCSRHLQRIYDTKMRRQLA